MEGSGNIEEGAFKENRVAYTSSDYRFTCANGAVYAICLSCPEDEVFHIRSFAAASAGAPLGRYNAPFHGVVHTVRVLGYDKEPVWHADPEGLHVQAPGLHSAYPVVIRIS